MKKKLLVIGLGMMLLLTACSGSGEKVIEKDATEVSKEVTQESSSEVAQTEKTETQEKSEKGYVFKWNSVTIAMDAEATPIVDALGEPISYFEAASCAFEGLDKMYTYNSFEVDTYPMNDADYISAVIFKDDSITTAEGVAIGDSKEKVKEVYGTDCAEQENVLIYSKDEMKLSFIFDGESVVSIQYSSTVLDE